MPTLFDQLMRDANVAPAFKRQFAGIETPGSPRWQEVRAEETASQREDERREFLAECDRRHNQEGRF